MTTNNEPKKMTFDELLAELADMPSIPLDALAQIKKTIRDNFNS